MNQTAEALLKRYRDAYGIVHSTVRLGSKIKMVALGVAILTALTYLYKVVTDFLEYGFYSSNFIYKSTFSRWVPCSRLSFIFPEL